MFEHISAQEPAASNDVNETKVTISLKEYSNLKELSKLNPSNLCRGVMVKSVYLERNLGWVEEVWDIGC